MPFEFSTASVLVYHMRDSARDVIASALCGLGMSMISQQGFSESLIYSVHSSHMNAQAQNIHADARLTTAKSSRTKSPRSILLESDLKGTMGEHVGLMLRALCMYNNNRKPAVRIH
eukprot:TRINITY_DN28293_c0_g1_i1.p1 TRINITY_DN28293_c0_g1~~TRINITY_DN28293_c0_g1_i1.p1  ORF type:complete len:116 (-),score=1.80 TRINITY_DN28293_c0_g1_i1:170-517(-)